MRSPSGSPSFREATLADLDIVLGMMPIYYAHDHLVFERSKAEAALRDFLSSPSHGKLWLVSEVEGGPAIGYAVVAYGFSFEAGGREAFIDELFVLDEFRGRGLGSATLEHAAKDARRAGVRALRLEVTATNADAGRLYRRLGFEDLGRSLLVRWLDEDARSVPVG
jgi:ribosomal protein S18 acetylase RimI-like enzyme